MSVRLRRLQAEYNRVAQLFANHDRISIVETYGNPPDRYIIEYRLRGLVEEKGEIRERAVHRAQIVLGRNYPNELPRCNMLTPVFHPNIDHLRICTEDIGAVGKTIDQVITFIGEMIAFQTYNVKSPLNGDAARWTVEHLDRLPLERIDLIPKETVRPPSLKETLQMPPAAPPAASSAQSATAATATVPRYLKQTVSAPEHCANCNQSAASIELKDCAGGHLVCQDCSLICQGCGKRVCVLCPVRTCANCQNIACTDCQVTCEFEGHAVCKDCTLACDNCGKGACVLCALGTCAGCRGLVCAICLETCATCGYSFCSSHAHRC